MLGNVVEISETSIEGKNKNLKKSLILKAEAEKIRYQY